MPMYALKDPLFFAPTETAGSEQLFDTTLLATISFREYTAVT